MTDVPGFVSRRDQVASETLSQARSKRLVTLRERAEKWIAGLTAVVTVLATATLFKGPEKFSEVPKESQSLLIGLMIAGGFGVLLGLLAAYSAAFGSVGKSNLDRLILNPPAPEGAANKLDEAVRKDWNWTFYSLRVALGATVLGVVALGAATVVALTDAAASDQADESEICATIGDVTVSFKERPEVVGPVEFLDECPG